jgi:hypothetical protein
MKFTEIKLRRLYASKDEFAQMHYKYLRNI